MRQDQVPGAEVLERFGLPDPFERIAQHRIDQIKDSKRHLAVCLHPPAEIFEKNRSEERGALKSIRGL